MFIYGILYVYKHILRKKAKEKKKMQYKITGGTLPVVICDLKPGESMITEKGAMSWMSPNMKMETKTGSAGRAIGRMLSGESMFLNQYTAKGGPGMIAFGSNLPGSILPINMAENNGIVCQKQAFLAAESSVDLSIYLQKRLGSGLFAGEGFILQKLSGRGTAFLEIDGSAIHYDLRPGQKIVIDTGHLAAMDGTCDINIQMIKGVSNVLFGGEGLFNTVVTGPGRVWIQSMPINKIIDVLSMKSRG